MSVSRIPGHLFPANGIVFVEVAQDIQLDKQRVFDERLSWRQLRLIIIVISAV